MTDGAGRVPADEFRAAVDTYFEGGAGQGTTVTLNRAAWQQWAIVPRMFRDVRHVDTSWSLFGTSLAAPVLAAPSAGHGLAHPDGERATARGVHAAGAALVLAQGSSVHVEDVAAESAPYLQQVYLPERRKVLEPFLDRVVAAGAVAIVLTVDLRPVGGSYPFRNGLLKALGANPAASIQTNFPGISSADLATDAYVRLADIEWLASQTGLPVLVKGILHPEDARLAIEAGAAGVVVSNHGGRQIDGSITTAEALPDIADAVGGRGLLLVDGGIRSGEDVLRALALGADAVLVGRPVVRGLQADGAPGVTKVLDDLRSGLAAVMAMSGVASVEGITSDLVRRRAFVPPSSSTEYPTATTAAATTAAAATTTAATAAAR